MTHLLIQTKFYYLPESIAVVLVGKMNFIFIKPKIKKCVSEFLETPIQAYFYANFLFCTRTFPAGDSNLQQFFSADVSQTL